jgi:hypothetical protein
VPHYSYSEKYHNIDRAKINVQCLHIFIETFKKQRRSIVWHEANLTHCDNKLTGIGGVSLRDLGVANLRFPKVEQDPKCMDDAMQHGKPLAIV